MVSLSSPLVLFSAALFLSYTVSAEVGEDPRKKIYEKCRIEANIPESAAAGIYNYASIDALKEHKCFLKCIFQNYKLLTPEGSMDENRTIEAMRRHWKTEENERKYAPVLRDCFAKVKKESDTCEYTFNIMNCFIEGKKKV